MIVSLILSMASPAWAAEPLHCKTQLSPESTDVGLAEVSMSVENPNPFMEVGKDGHFMNIRLDQTRRCAACNVDVAKDIAYWTQLYRDEGCSDDSPVARSFRWFWTVGVDEMNAERKRRSQNAPRNSKGLISESYIRGIVHCCLYLHQTGAWHLSTTN